MRIGIPSMLGSYYSPPILMGFKHRYPDLRLSVYEPGGRRFESFRSRHFIIQINRLQLLAWPVFLCLSNSVINDPFIGQVQSFYTFV
ncbi:MAG: hypothetical protein KZQ88_08775 [Candidatus Thiodiazotropha sp. (ex Dulcina madagascariensis)]|nr:hypothetical protein [Candidatus Thiodiazotropha sp. (ex Dulcina madagascariensis)]MCU7928183.1 hypothetical protein [Candidatus Thiodiazotropha sp. (ex Dulcina madagascariensis)]